MTYLDASEYEAYGLDPTTPDAWVSVASSLMNAYCRRETLAVSQYTERLRLRNGAATVRLSYLPLAVVPPATTPLVSARGRYAAPGRMNAGCADWAWEIAQVFGLPGTWTDLQTSNIDCCVETGELVLPGDIWGLGLCEVEVAYTAGFATVPDAIKCACAQVVRNALGTPALNVRAQSLDRMHVEYFSDTLLDQTVRTLLAPWVAQKVG